MIAGYEMHAKPYKEVQAMGNPLSFTDINQDLDPELTPEEQNIEDQLIRYYDRQNEDQATQLKTDLKAIIDRGNANHLITLFFKLANDLAHSKQFRFQLLETLLTRHALDKIWLNEIEKLIEKNKQLTLAVHHHLGHKNSKRPLFYEYAALQVHIHNRTTHLFRHYAECALAAYDNDKPALALEELKRANSLYRTTESELLYIYWQYQAGTTDHDTPVILAHYAEQHTDSSIALKLLLIDSYRKKNLTHCLSLAARLSTLEPNYAFLVLPALLALQQNNLDRAYEVLCSLLENTAHKPLSHKTPSKTEILQILFNSFSYLPWTHTEKKAQRDNKKYLRKAQKQMAKNADSIPQSMLWRIMTLLSIAHLKQALVTENKTEQMALYKRAQSILMTVIRYAFHFVKVVHLLHALQSITRFTQKSEEETIQTIANSYHIELIRFTKHKIELQQHLISKQNKQPEKNHYVIYFNADKKNWYLANLSKNNQVQRIPFLSPLKERCRVYIEKNPDTLSSKEKNQFCQAVCQHLAEHSSQFHSNHVLSKLFRKKPTQSNLEKLANEVQDTILSESLINMEIHQLLHSKVLETLMKDTIHNFTDTLEKMRVQDIFNAKVAAHFGNCLSRIELLLEQLETVHKRIKCGEANVLPAYMLQGLNYLITPIFKENPVVGCYITALTYKYSAKIIADFLAKKQFNRQQNVERLHGRLPIPDSLTADEFSVIAASSLAQLDNYTLFRLEQYYRCRASFYIHVTENIQHSPALPATDYSLLGHCLLKSFSADHETAEGGYQHIFAVSQSCDHALKSIGISNEQIDHIKKQAEKQATRYTEQTNVDWMQPFETLKAPILNDQNETCMTASNCGNTVTYTTDTEALTEVDNRLKLGR